MKSLITKRPDLFVLNAVWITALLFHLLNLPVMKAQVTLDALVYLGIFLFAANFVLVGTPGLSSPKAVHPARFSAVTWAVVAGGLGVVLLGAFGIYRTLGIGGPSLSEIRASYAEEVEVGNVSRGIGYSLFIVGMPIWLFVFDIAIRYKNRILITASVLCAAVACIAIGLSTGGRAEFNLMVVFAVAVLITNYRIRIAANLKRLFLRGLLVLVLFVVANGIFFYFRMQGEDHVRARTIDVHIENATAALSRVGLDSIPDPVLYVYSYVTGYAAAPVGNLSHFMEFYEMDESWGFFQMRLMYNRVGAKLGVFPPREKKFETDLMYFPLGYYSNVWATGMREMIMDFGELGSIAAVALMFLLIGVSRGFLFDYLGGRVIYCLGFAWIILSPFTSLFLTRMYEVAWYYAVLSLVIELMFGAEWFLFLAPNAAESKARPSPVGRLIRA